MANLGEFGAAEREVDPDREKDTITLCGVEFTVADRINPLAILKFGKVAAAGVDGESPQGMEAMLALIQNAVEVDEWAKFEATVDRHRPEIEDLMNLSMAVIQRDTGRPTQQPSDSSDGSSTTGVSSKELSSSVEPSPLDAWRNSPLGRRELAADPEAYADVMPLNDAAVAALKLAETG